jgi:hypothetical protein
VAEGDRAAERVDPLGRGTELPLPGEHHGRERLPLLNQLQFATVAGMAVSTRRALRFEAWGRPPRLADVEPPTPRDGEVLVEVTAAGVCHSDLGDELVLAGLTPVSR